MLVVPALEDPTRTFPVEIADRLYCTPHRRESRLRDVASPARITTLCANLPTCQDHRPDVSRIVLRWRRVSVARAD